MQCGTCGNTLASGLTACSSCGAPQAIHQNQQINPPQAQPPPPAHNTPYAHQPPQQPMYQAGGTPKNKTLMIVLIVAGVLVLLGIIGAVIFFVTNKNDSEEKSDDGSQEKSEEADDEKDNKDNEDADRNDNPIINNDQTLKLEDLGFDCQIVTFLENAANLGDDELSNKYAEKIENSRLSDKGFSICEHNDDYILVDFMTLADAELDVGLLTETICELIEEDDDLGEDAMQKALGSLKERFQKFAVIGSYIYIAQSNSDDLEFKALLDEAEIEYGSYDVPELSCDN